jgi:hypothetical protein
MGEPYRRWENRIGVSALGRVGDGERGTSAIEPGVGDGRWGVWAREKTVADTPTRRHANTPIRQYANTPIRQYANTPIRQYANTPTRRHVSLSMCVANAIYVFRLRFTAL